MTGIVQGAREYANPAAQTWCRDCYVTMDGCSNCLPGRCDCDCGLCERGETCDRCRHIICDECGGLRVELEMMKRDARALELLRLGVGSCGAHFRAGQEDAVRHVVEGRGRLLVVQRTGWGKSFVYFIATKLLREAGMGPTLLVSPLLALMRNQIAAAERMGVRAATINSNNVAAWEQVERDVIAGRVDILIISPERLGNERFVSRVLATVASRISLLVVDEAHCISDWGHDFRPDYRRIGRILRELPPNLRLLATTATANDRVVADLDAVLGPDLAVRRGSLHRPSLNLQTIRLRSQAERLAWLAEQIPRMPGSGIVYTLTVRDAEEVADWLRSRNIEAEAYTGQTGPDRPALEQALLNNQVKALVATSALGMGFDKPDLGFVIHYQAPGSVIAYYQQVGRAGRALRSAWGVLLGGEEDLDITNHFIDTAFPSRDQAREVLSALEQAPDGLSRSDLLRQVNIRFGRLDQALKILSLESPAPVVKEGRRWQLTAAELGEEFWQRVERLTALRRREQEQLQKYLDLESGHMAFLIRALDGDPKEVGEAAAAATPLPAEPGQDTVREAVAFLKGAFALIEPRKKGPKKLIRPEHRAETGRALCHWNDAGWGRLVRSGKYESGWFADELVEACAGLARDWQQAPAPEWVTCVPSLRHPDLVPDFAARLAAALGLAFAPALRKTENRNQQKTMENSPRQAANVWGSLAVEGSPSPAPVLLIDDIVDSRWTFTVAAWLLRKHGSGEVWPLALAQA